MRKVYFIRFGIYITVVLLLAAYACDGGTGPGDGVIQGFLYLCLESTGDGCVKKTRSDDGSLVYDIDLEAGSRIYDIAVNLDNGDFYVYYGTDVKRYSKDGKIVTTIENVTEASLIEKLLLAPTSDGRYLWVINAEYEVVTTLMLICFNVVTGELVSEGSPVYSDGDHDIKPGSGSSVWVLSEADNIRGIRRYGIGGEIEAEIVEPGLYSYVFNVDTNDNSIWAVYDSGDFVKYDSAGAKTFVFNAGIADILYGRIIIEVNGVTGDVLLVTNNYIIAYSEEGIKKFEIETEYIRDICYHPDGGSWFLLRAKAPSGSLIENRDPDTGEVLRTITLSRDYPHFEFSNQ